MTKRRITFEVDIDQLFTQLQAMGGDAGPLGQRVVATLLAPSAFRDQIGMAVYGIVIVPEDEKAAGK